MVPDHSSFDERKVESAARMDPEYVAEAPEKPAAAARARPSSSDDEEEEESDDEGMDQEYIAEAPEESTTARACSDGV